MSSVQRFFGPFNIKGDQERISDPEVLHQLKDVLRLGPGDKVVLVDQKGNEATGEIVKLTKEFAELVLSEHRRNEAEPKREVTLYCAVLKRENFEWVVQKATEVGVREIVPIITKRTIKLGLNLERLQKIMKEAAEQSGRGIVPALREPANFQEALDLAGDRTNIVFDASGENLSKIDTHPQSMNIWIGPEGGWDLEEVERARETKCKIAHLGPLTLRAETAAVVASYLVVQISQ